VFNNKYIPPLAKAEKWGEEKKVEIGLVSTVGITVLASHNKKGITKISTYHRGERALTTRTEDMFKWYTKLSTRLINGCHF
jgi:galactose-1-phosphate uridylyltransferase